MGLNTFTWLLNYISSHKKPFFLEMQRFGENTDNISSLHSVIISMSSCQIIDYATAYKPILTAIKKEYDDFIASVNYDQHQAQLAHGKLKAMLAQPTSFMYYQRRADQLQER